MAKVTVHKGATIPGPEKSYKTWRVDLTISDIDTEGDIDAQIKKALEVHEKVSAAMAEPLAQDAADTSTLAIEGLGVSEKFDKLLVDDKAWKDSVVKEVKKLQKMVKND